MDMAVYVATTELRDAGRLVGRLISARSNILARSKLTLRFITR